MGNQITLTPAEEAAVLAYRSEGVPLTPPAPPAPPPEPAGRPAQGVPVGSKAQQIVQALNPMLTATMGAKGAAIGTLGSEVADIGTVIWRMFDKHTGTSSDHASLADAQQAAVVQMHSKHAKALTQPANPTAMEITPVIKIGVQDVTTQPTPVLPAPTNNVTHSS